MIKNASGHHLNCSFFILKTGKKSRLLSDCPHQHVSFTCTYCKSANTYILGMRLTHMFCEFSTLMSHVNVGNFIGYGINARKTAFPL